MKPIHKRVSFIWKLQTGNTGAGNAVHHGMNSVNFSKWVGVKLHGVSL
jgi:hypothetical protein